MNTRRRRQRYPPREPPSHAMESQQSMLGTRGLRDQSPHLRCFQEGTSPIKHQ